EYLIYADPMASADEALAAEGDFFTSICSGTAPLEHAAPDLRFLRGEPPAPEDLLDGKSYYERALPLWTGKVCGQIADANGKPLAGALLSLWQVRDEPFPSSKTIDGSEQDGTFCSSPVFPGKYLLTAEKYDWDEGTRLMGFYPGVWKHAEAATIE